jgi:hypothetical protein
MESVVREHLINRVRNCGLDSAGSQQVLLAAMPVHLCLNLYLHLGLISGCFSSSFSFKIVCERERERSVIAGEP